MDLTTFFVRPLPPDLDGFVVGGMGTGGFDEEMSDEGGAKDCSLATASEKRQRALVMQVGKSVCVWGGFSVCGHSCAVRPCEANQSKLLAFASPNGRSMTWCMCVFTWYVLSCTYPRNLALSL